MTAAPTDKRVECPGCRQQVRVTMDGKIFGHNQPMATGGIMPVVLQAGADGWS